MKARLLVGLTTRSDSRRSGVSVAGSLVEVCSIGLPGPHELWIESLARTAALQAAK